MPCMQSQYEKRRIKQAFGLTTEPTEINRKEQNIIHEIIGVGLVSNC